MPLYFDKVSLLSLTQEYRALEAGFQYLNLKNFSIQGNVTDLTNVDGVQGIINGIIQTTDNFYSYQPIILNGQNFGCGKVVSINFSASNDVQLDSFTANIQVYNSGDLFNLAGPYYPNVDTSNWNNLQNFDESYNFIRKDNGGYSYTHNANIQFSSGCANIEAINQAKDLARSLFTGSTLGLAFYPGYTSKVGKRFNTESYNLIENNCNFQETFDFDSDSGSYSFTQNNTFELTQNGIVNVTENGNVRGITSPNFQRAREGFNIEIGKAKARCTNVFDTYTSGFADLINTPISENVSYDLFNNEINYTIIFSNDPKNQNTFYWSYTDEQSKDSDGYFIASENGTLIGRGADRGTAYGNAATGYNQVVLPGMGGRINSFPSSPNNFYEVNVSKTYSPFKGIVSYSHNFSNKPATLNQFNMRRIEVVQSTNESIYQWNKFSIFNEGEILQDAQTSVPSAQRIELNLYGKSTSVLSNYLDAAKQIINNNFLPEADNAFITEASYTYNPNERIVNLSVGWESPGDGNKGILL